jgi:hypothetical protein
MDVISQHQLPFSRIASELVGDDHGGLPVSLLFIDAPPGRGPGLHTHAYHELFIVQEGTVTFTAGDRAARHPAPLREHRRGPAAPALDPDEPALRDRVALVPPYVVNAANVKGGWVGMGSGCRGGNREGVCTNTLTLLLTSRR